MGVLIELILEVVSAAVEYLVWIFTGKRRSEDTPPRITPDNGDHGNQSKEPRGH